MSDGGTTDPVSDLSWTTRREAGVTLVELTVRNGADGPRVVRVESTVPAWPPRRRGVPAEGWDGDAVELRLAAGERRGVGYASPESADPPAEVAWSRTPDEDHSFEPAADVPDPEPTAAGVERALGSPSPPGDAVPTTSGRDADDATGSRPGGRDGDLPESVASWLDDVTRRVERVESLAAVETLPEATEAVGDAGGLDGATEVTTRVDADAEALRAVAARATELADRAEAANPPVGTFRRLA